MTLQYLQNTATPTAFFGDRYLTLSDPSTQRILGIFGSVLSTGLTAPLGINGQPGQVYDVPIGKQFIAYMWKFNAGLSYTSDPPPQIRIELGNNISNEFNPLAAINADIKQIGPPVNSTFTDVLNETNAIAVLFKGGERPEVRGVAASGTIGAMFSGSVEVYGIESDEGTPVL